MDRVPPVQSATEASPGENGPPAGVFDARQVVTDPEVLAGYSEDASSIIGAPEGLLRPTEPQDVAAALAHAAGEGIPVTPCGLRTSTTGAGLAPRGWTLSTERMTGLIDLDPVRRTAIVGAGTVLREFKDLVEAEGLFYPPDPTSERECAVGGTVACDASGARTYRYGATHRWVRGLEVVFTDGTVRWLRRPEIEKDAAGYAALRDLVRLFCGSEGTLGVITKVEVDLLARPEAFTAGFGFFGDVQQALAFVDAARREDRLRTGVNPRCLELLDGLALQIMAAQDSGVAIPANAGAAIFFEEEHVHGGEMAVMEAWWALLSSSEGALAEDTVVASNRAEQEELRLLRHAVPATLNDEGRSHREAGGKKISTDWAVPFHYLAPLVAEFDGWIAEAGLDRVARYGHVGNGHPHYNLIVKNHDEAARAAEIVDRMCREACRVGGTVTAEHGVGKVKREYAAYRFSPLHFAAMKGIKRAFDPSGILAPGNIWHEE